MKTRAVLACTTSLLAAGIGCASSGKPLVDPVTEASRAQILAELNQYYADFSARKWSAFAAHFWPDATITTIWQPPGEAHERVVVTSIDQFIQRAPLGPGSKSIFDERMTGAQVRVEGGLAQVWSKYTARFGEPGDIAAWSGTDAFTLVQHEGQWKIAALAFAAEQ